MRTAYFYMTSRGGALTEKLTEKYPGRVFGKAEYKQAVAECWQECDALVFVMASGIVVRTIAPFIKSKTTDPAVVVLDQEGRFVISLLSGHLGGANALALALAKVTGGQAVITTATDVEKVPAMDVFAKENGLKIENIHVLKYISSAMVEKKPLAVLSQWAVEGDFPPNVSVLQADRDLNRHIISGDDGQAVKSFAGILPEMVSRVLSGEKAAVPVTVIGTPAFGRMVKDMLAQAGVPGRPVLYLTKQPYVIGTGCKKNMDAESYREAFEAFVCRQGIDKADIGALATIELKKDEVCINTLAEELNVPVRIFKKEEIEQVDLSDASGKCIAPSDFVQQITGVGSVSEVCAWLGAKKGKIIAGKTKFKGITFALAKEEVTLKL